MKKLRMDVDGLSVESFDTKEEKPQQGTVQAHECYTPGAGGYTCDWRANTCRWDSCDGVCSTYFCTGG
ncbi:MAG TPA: hypothetical protein VHG91_19225 [Longimicrobium sp.]|nr:hypothetical protein [Longimicrobium sp.]